MQIEPFFFNKQQRVVNWWFNHTTTQVNELLYGGAAGGGKTRVGVSVLILSALTYEGSRWVVGRSRLKVLKQTTMVTFYEVCKEWGLKEKVHFKTDNQANEITFFNGSKVILFDLFAFPSDPNFDRLGSLEICGAFVDEVPQVMYRAVSVLGSRIRYNLKKWCECGAENGQNKVVAKDENGEPIKWKCENCGNVNEGLRPKMLMSCNPTRGWVYTEFYDKERKGVLPNYRRFIQSLVTDNPKISKHYIEQLNRLPKIDRERLLKGSWDYADFTAIFDFEKIQVLTQGKGRKQSKETTFVCAVDVARLGKDKTVIMVMSSEKQIVEVIELTKARTNEVAEKIDELKRKYNLTNYEIAIDTDGVGGGVADYFDGCVEIANNARALSGENYENIKTQMFFKLAEEINTESITAVNGVFTDEQAETIAQELEVIKRAKVDRDGKLAITPKAEVKQMLQRSPDYADCLAYLMIFVLQERFSNEYFMF